MKSEKLELVNRRTVLQTFLALAAVMGGSLFSVAGKDEEEEPRAECHSCGDTLVADMQIPA